MKKCKYALPYRYTVLLTILYQIAVAIDYKYRYPVVLAFAANLEVALIHINNRLVRRLGYRVGNGLETAGRRTKSSGAPSFHSRTKKYGNLPIHSTILHCKNVYESKTNVNGRKTYQ
jgi:hypothetical protein